MTKSKSSTIAIVVLSVLLAAALASTIVLAAFNFSREATTTITFGNGIAVDVTGIEGSDPYYWDYTQGSTDGSVGSINVTGGDTITLKQITAEVTTETAAFIAIKANIAETPNNDDITKTPLYNTTAGTYRLAGAATVTGCNQLTGWYIVVKSDSATTAASINSSAGEVTMINATELYNPATDAAAGHYDGQQFVCTVMIAAASDLAGLLSTCDELDDEISLA